MATQSTKIYWVIMKKKTRFGLGRPCFVYGPFTPRQVEKEFSRYVDMYGKSGEFYIRLVKEVNPLTEPS